MSGGQLVVLDRLGRDVKRFPLAEGLVTLGSDHSCDIRFMLDTVNPHHATVAVHANQTVIRNVCEGETRVNGRCVSVAALRHGDVIGIGGRQLRWDYADPTVRRLQAPQPALYVGRRAGRVPRRTSGPTHGARRDPQLQLKLEMAHRASMPANAGGKQVAIVQPQRRDTNDQNEKSPRSPIQSNKRSRASRNDLDTSASSSDVETEKVPRKSSLRASPGALHGTTKATLWIESRKSSPRTPAASPQTGAGSPRTGAGSPRTGAASPRTGAASPRTAAASPRTGPTGTNPGPAVRRAASARKSTPLRLTVLKRAQSAQKMKVTKIEAPLKIDHTKQAAILLMTGHTPKSRLLGQKTPSPKSESPKLVSPKSVVAKSVSPKSVGRRSASFVVKKKSPVVRRSTPRGRSSRVSGVSALADTPTDRTVTILEITDSAGRNSTLRQTSRRSQRSFEQSPLLPSPKKSALKNPLAKKSMRKTESIKFDLSNLENRSQESDVMTVADSPQDTISLRYSTSSALSPSPRRSIHSRSSRMLQQTLGTPVLLSPSSKSETLAPVSPRRSTSHRGSVILQRALNKSAESVSRSSRDGSVPSAFRTRTLSPRESQNDLESYSIVDLVSIDSNESGRSTSVYNSAGSTSSTTFVTPRDSTGRKTRSTIDATLLGSSTPYVKATRSSTPRSRSSPNVSTRTSNDSTRLTTDLTARSTRASKNKTWASNSTSRLSSNSSRLSSNSSRLSSKSSRSINKSSVSTRKTKSLSTPENATIPISVNSTRISRASRSRTRINDSDLLLIEPEEADDSPRSSKRASKDSKRSSSAPQRGSKSLRSSSVGTTPTQENGIITPENNQSPEEASTPVLSIQSLLDSSQNSIRSQPKKKGRPSLKRKTIGVISGPKARASIKSKSMNFSARRSRLRMSNDSYENMNVSEQNSENVTPKSAVTLVHEAVKNKHSTAKKTQSKRSMIDDLNESDIVKQLFNSPVKRKLSQSMTEFSRKHLFDDDVVQMRRPTRNTVALTGRTPDNSLLDNSEAFTPEQFVSPMSTPSHSPNLTGIKRLFVKKTPENDLRNVRGVKALLRTPRARRSIKNDLTDVVGVKAVFAKSPKNRLSDVRVKEVFASSPKNDLRRVSGVKALFQSEKERKSPRNSLGDVRGVKRMFNRKSAANDLRNVSGVKKALQRNSPNNDLRDVRGVKRLFRHDKAKNDLSDMSGVEELFNESNTSHRDADSLFDQLIGKPTIKAVYSKTFTSKTSKKIQKKTSPKSKSLISLDIITDNPEEWLEQKLQEIRSKRLQKEAQSSNKSANKSKLNVTRALMKLATDTVEGSSPIRTSRVRHSTVTRTSIIEVPKQQKSASELYSAHMLPIKKRSLVDASLERVKKDKVVNLPIKKRVVVHSTPMKGRQVNMTMNASELGRVSPIVAEKTRDFEHDIPSNINQEAVESRPKGRRGTRAQSATSPKVKKPTPKKSPKTTRGKSKVPTPVKTKPATPTKDKTPAKTKTPSPAKKPASPEPKAASPKATRSRRTAASPKAEANTKKRGATLVVAKKTPVMSPKASRTRKVPESVPSPKASPKASRKQKEPETVPTPKASPKASRKRKEPESVPTPKASPKASRKRKETVSVPTPKPSPKASRKRKETESVPTPKPSPKASRKRKETESVPTPKPSPRASRKRKETESVPTPKASPKASRKRKEPESVPTPKASPKASRKRKETESVPTPKPSPKASRKRKEPESLPTPKASPKRTRATRNKDDNVVQKPKTPKNTRAKVLKATVVVSKPSPQIKPRATRGRAQQSTSQVQKETPKPKAKSKKESPKKSPVQQKSAKNTSVENVPKTRRRNNTATNDESKQNDVEKPVPKSKRGRNAKEEEPTVTRHTRKTEKQEVPVEEPKKPRGRKVEQQDSTQSEPTTRSRRGAKPNTTAPEVNTRKRKSTVTDDRPTKISKNVVETKGRSKKIESPKSETANIPKKAGRESKANKQVVSAAPKKATRANKTDVSTELTKQPAQRPTRGKKSAVVEPAPETGKRKRKPAVEAKTPVEDKKGRSTRSRAEPAPAAGKTTGRARRR